MRNRLTISTVTPSLDVVTGFGARELITELRNGRPPMWSSNPRGWVIHPKTTPDLVAFAQARGYFVRIDEAEEVR